MEPKSPYSAGADGLQEMRYLRAKRSEDIKAYAAALPKVKKVDYMERASLGQTFGPPSSNLSSRLPAYIAREKSPAPSYNSFSQRNSVLSGGSIKPYIEPTDLSNTVFYGSSGGSLGYDKGKPAYMG